MKRLSIIFLLIVFALTSCGNKPEPDVFLKMNGKYYNVDDLYKYIPEKRFTNMNSDSRKKTVNDYIKTELIKLAAKDQNLVDDSPELKKDVEKRKEELLIRTFHDRTILDSIINETILRDMYEKQLWEVRASHILLSTKKGPNNTPVYSDEEAKNKIDEIYQEIKNGASFDALAREYSQDPGSAAKGGDLGYFSRGKMVAPFENTAFSMNVGDISEPVKTQFGYHVIYLTDKKKNDKLAKFEDEKENLKKQAIQKYINQLRGTFQKNRMKYLKEADITVSPDAIQYIFDEFNKNHYAGTMVDILKKYDQSKSIVKMGEKEYDIAWLVKQMETYSFLNPRSFLTAPEEIGQLLEEACMTMVYREKAIALGLDKDKELVKQIDNYTTQLNQKEFEANKIKPFTNVSEDEIQSYYEKNMEKEFMEKEKVETYEIFVTDENQAINLIEKLNNGADFDELAAENTMRYKSKKGYLGFISDRNPLGKIALKMEIGEISEKPVRSGNGWTILKVTDKKAAEPKKLESIESLIKNKIKNKKTNEAKQKLVKKLKKKYHVTIWWDTLNITE